MSPALDLAREYLARGFRVVPVPPGRKGPVISGWEALRLTVPDLPTHFSNGNNIGLILGQTSNGLVDVDLDAPEAVAVAPYFLPHTPMWSGHERRPRTHAWYFATGKIPTTHKLVDPRDKTNTIVELRGTGGQTIVAPSVHPDGDSYEWNGSLDPEPVDGDELLLIVHKTGAAALMARCWPRVPGVRDDLAMALSGALLRGGWTVPDVEHFLEAVATVAGDDEARKRVATVKRTAAKLEAGEEVTGAPTLEGFVGVDVVKALHRWLALRSAADAPAEDHQTEMGLADRFVREHGERLRYCWGWDDWLAWDGARWMQDAEAEVWQMAKATVRSLLAKAATLPEGDARKAAVRFAMIAERDRTIRAALSLARSEPEIAVRPDMLNVDVYTLNTPTGMVDLRTGAVRPHNPAALLTKLCPTPYDPAAAAPTFDGFLSRIFAGDKAVIQFLQRLFGYAATGSCREHVLPIFWGAGANGKSTLTAAIVDTLGSDYAGPIAHSLLFAESKDSHPTAVADLYGRRVAVTHELDGGTRLAEGLVKSLTGGDRIKARRMREDLWEFTPTHTLFLATNTKPIVRGTDDGIWRRLKLVPFGVQIPEADRDTELGDKLKADAPGILAWIVAGARAWYANGLGTPASVRAATADYRSASDTLGEFIAAECAVGPDKTVRPTVLYDAYVAWHAREIGGDPWTQTTIGRRLTDRGFARKRDKRGEREWRGLALAPPKPPPALTGGRDAV